MNQNREFKSLVFPVTLLIILFALLATGSRSISFTSDEPAHIVTGYTFIARGREALWTLPFHGHPPLLNVLEAILFYLEDPTVPVNQLNGWKFDHIRYVRAFVKYFPPPDRAEFLARIPIMLFTVSLGALTFRWGTDLWGKRAGLLALFVLCLDPLLLAHGRLATTDVGTVTLGTASLYMAWRWSRFPSWRKAISWGILLGLTMLAKMSGALWVVAVALLCLWKVARGRKISWLFQGLIGGLISLGVLWAGCFFTVGPLQGIYGTYPAPDYWAGVLEQAQSAERRWVFALGDRKFGNWWWYFPLAFMIKNPIPLLIALSLGIVQEMRSTNRSYPALLVVFPIIYAAAAIRGGMNIGYRHMLPVHPLIYLLVGKGIAVWLSSPNVLKKLAVGLLGIWYVAETISIFPFEIAYFNEFVGGPRNAHRYLIDSNLDWGQGYKDLRFYLSENPEPIPKFVYQYSYILPEYYGIFAQSVPAEDVTPYIIHPLRPDAGRYILNITTVQSGWFPRSDMYVWFRQARPTAVIGYSFFVYNVNHPPLRWIAQCSVPAVPLSRQAIAWGFGQQDIRQIEFDCESGWIYPFGGGYPGVYSFHYALIKDRRRTFPSLLLSSPEPRDPFLSHHLEQTRLSVDMNQYAADYPAFVLYELENAIQKADIQSRVYLCNTDCWDGAVFTTTTPIALQGPLTFLGADVIRESNEMNVETWWQVTEGPITRPLSIMGHLLNGVGEMIGQDDGLGVSPILWQPGDILVQRHRFPLPEEQDLWLRTGVYWLDTMERWRVIPEVIIGGDLILIPLGEGG